MPRKAFNICSLISLILCLITVGVWIRSYFVHDSRKLGPKDHPNRMLVSANGKIHDVWLMTNSVTGKESGYDNVTGGAYYVSIVAGFGTLPFLWLLGWAIRREGARFNPYACKRCGYDLRASPERCSECGAPRTAVSVLIDEAK